MAATSKGQQQTIARVMDEFKHGALESGGGEKVRDRKQAIAIALSEAGASNQQSPAQNRHRLAKTKRGERAAEKTRAELYAIARRKGVVGRSRMSRDELTRAVA